MEHQKEHGDTGKDEIAQDRYAFGHIADQHCADPHVTIESGIGDERKLPALQSPNERQAAGGKQPEKPREVTLAAEDTGEECAKIGRWPRDSR